MDKMQKIKQEDMHQTMRGYFAGYLYNEMLDNDKIWLVVGDLGFRVFDRIKEDFPDRFLNTGASEQAASDICVGLALKGVIPFFYSITPFGLYRAFETWRTYVNHEKIPVKMAFSGRDADYRHDGYSHNATDAMQVLTFCLPNIKQLWPEGKGQIADMVNLMVSDDKPYFISLKKEVST